MAEGSSAPENCGYVVLGHLAQFSAIRRVEKERQTAAKSGKQSSTGDGQLADLFAKQMKLDDNDEEHMTSEEDIAAYNRLKKYSLHKPYCRTLCDEPTENLVHLSLPKKKKFSFDLSVGFARRIDKDFENEHISLILECFEKQSIAASEGDFVSKRGCLTRIATSCYSEDNRFDEGSVVAVQLFKGVFYISEFKTPPEQDTRQKLDCYQGLKFETYVTAKKGGKPEPRQIADFNNDFHIVAKAKLNEHSLIVSCEVDCCEADNENRYVELKTRKEHTGYVRDRITPNPYKSCDWWMQSFLLGVEHIVCGVRDDEGKVIDEKSIEHYRLSELKQKMQPERNPQHCIDRLQEFLSRVKSEVKVELVPHVFCRSKNVNNFEEEVSRDESFSFLPWWFTKMNH